MSRPSLPGKIRVATVADAAALRALYAPYVENTSVTFEYAVPTVPEFEVRVEQTLRKYPWLLYEENGVILGYAYAGADRTREAYQWMAESSIYLSEEAWGRGIGTALYSALFSVLTAQNFCRCTALITEGNEPSFRLHEKFGFTVCGHMDRAGYKLGAWHGMTTMEKFLNPFTVPPKAILPFPELLKNPKILQEIFPSFTLYL